MVHHEVEWRLRARLWLKLKARVLQALVLGLYLRLVRCKDIFIILLDDVLLIQNVLKQVTLVLILPLQDWFDRIL